MRQSSWLVLGWVLVFPLLTLADKAEPMASMARLPVKEVTIFKDGHAFVLHAGTMPTDAQGNVVMDYLPNPVLGTFWPYSADKNAKLTAVTASQHKVLISRTALSLRELIEANIGAAVTVTEVPLGAGDKAAAISYPATILSIPTQTGEELEATSPPNSGDKLPVKGNLVVLKTVEGDKVVNIDRLADITFKAGNANHQSKLDREEFRNLLKLKLDWAKGPTPKEAAVGLVYLQRGLRWIPHYKVSIDGAGNAVLQLQATLVNELTDLEDVTANLVIGVPTFNFKDQNDPISLQQAVAQVVHNLDNRSQMLNMSNAIQSQAAYMPRMAENAPGAVPPVDLGPEVSGAVKTEDLFVFSVQHITLKKGQRMVLPVTEFKLKYRDVYTVDIPFTPPPEAMQQFGGRQDIMAKLFAGPKAMHTLRLTNTSTYPLTTAPAMILRDNRLLAQGMMTYASPGGECDLDLTTALDIQIKKTDSESSRTPDAARWNNDQYGRIDLAGKITLRNFGKQPVEVEVVRHVLGNVNSTDNNGKSEMVNIFEDNSFKAAGNEAQPWWTNYSWPYWWHHFNGVGRITWKITLEPEKPVDLGYTWHYYWR